MIQINLLKISNQSDSSKTPALRKNIRSQNGRSKNVLLHVLSLSFEVKLLKTQDVCELFSISFCVLKKIVKSFKRKEEIPSIKFK